MKRYTCLILGTLMLGLFQQPQVYAEPDVSNVRALQRQDGSRLVDIWYDLAHPAGEPQSIALKVLVDNEEITASTFRAGSAVGENITPGRNKEITWDARADWDGQYSRNVQFVVEVGSDAGDYLVIDLSSGPSSSSYPVTYYNAVPTGGWTDEYKTTKLVLRRIPAGAFTMGSPPGELGRWDARESQRQVTLTQDFYIGVFQVTQKQWERVMGDWPSHFENVNYRKTRPLESRSWNDIRGGVWPGEPSGSGQPAAGTFVQRISSRTGLTFDLPTEAQWEYACRAGTTTALNSGKNITTDQWNTPCPHVAEVGRYYHNHPGGYSSSPTVSTAGGTAKVGSYLPNAWGLYDMHGNVWEWCLDWYVAEAPGSVDPVGAASGSYRVLRGGSWGSYVARFCRSAYRGDFTPSFRYFNYGFRLSRTLP